MKFCQIAPVQYLEPLRSILQENTVHLLLAHLVETNKKYTDFYNSLKSNVDHATNYQTFIMDNAGFELYRQGLPMFEPEKLIDLAHSCQADYIVLPDYPGEHYTKTIEAAQLYAPKFKEMGFKTFFVPQSQSGKLEDYITSFAWAVSSPLIDYVGLSILGIPIAYGVDKPGHIQTFGARLAMVQQLTDRMLFELARVNKKKIHFLGMTDGPNEILIASKYYNLNIDSWDSSAAVWAGIQGIPFDSSPTGLMNGKIHSHVDFDIKFDDSKLLLIKENIRTIKKLVNRYNDTKIVAT